MKRLSVIMTHPIQYNAPWIRLLAERKVIKIKVFYTWSQVESGLKFDPGFGRNIEWDIPLLEGYEYEFVPNTARHPGSREHRGIKNPGLIQKIEAYSPDALLVNGWNFDSHYKCIKYFHNKVPILFRGDSTLLDKQNVIRSSLRKIILTRVYKKIDFALFTGSANKSYFLRYGMRERQLIFVPHAVDNQRFASNAVHKKAAAELRNSLNIPRRELVFLYAGKLEAKKDPLLLLEAFTELSIRNVHLVIVGNGEMENELKQKFGHAKNIYFKEFQNQKMMPMIYELADIFVLPSRGPGETWGLAVNEAMAAGKPVIVSEACGCAQDLVEEGGNGFVFQQGCKKALMNKMIWFIENRHAIQEMGAQSFAIIQNWSFDQVALQLEQKVLSLHKNYTV